MMSKQKIAYQVEPGANSHIASADVFPDMEPLPCATFEDALAAISDGTAALGMIPIENSLAGRVADIHQFLPTSGLHIVGEYFLPIHFQLMAMKGADVSKLTDVYSHVHALGQCRRIIRQYDRDQQGSENAAFLLLQMANNTSQAGLTLSLLLQFTA